MKKIIINAVAILAIAFLVVTGLVLFVSNHIDKRAFKSTIIENYNNETYISKDVIEQTTLLQNTTIPISRPTEQVTISPSATPVVTTTNDDNAMASITITTNRKTRTYDVMPNVDEKTLKKNIGYLPSSALPGQEGMCVLMGHRDTDFRILKYADIGDEFKLSFKENEYTYIIAKIDIVKSDNALRFNVIDGSTLILVTCYPFRYSGHAISKYLVFAKLN